MSKFIVDTISSQCWHCRTNLGWGPMLRPSVWASIAPQRAILCRDCQEMLLKRPLRVSDLSCCPMNDKWVGKIPVR